MGSFFALEKRAEDGSESETERERERERESSSLTISIRQLQLVVEGIAREVHVTSCELPRCAPRLAIAGDGDGGDRIRGRGRVSGGR